MQVNTVSGSSFGQKQQSLPREAIERLANADDRELRYFARQQASIAVNDKKYNKINNILYRSIPVAMGLSAVALNPAKNAVILTANKAKVLSPLTTKLGTYAKTTAKWMAGLAIIDALIAGNNKLNDHSQAVRKFESEHSLLTNVAAAGIGLGVLTLGNKALPLLKKPISKLINSKTKDKILETVIKADERLTNKNFVKTLTKGFNAIPSAIRNTGKYAIGFGPLMIGGAQLLHFVNHRKAKRQETINQYEQLKQSQAVAKTVIEALDRIEAEKAAKATEEA